MSSHTHEDQEFWTRFDNDLMRRAEEMRERINNERELLTPLALAVAFDLSETTIRTAQHKGRIRPFVVFPETKNRDRRLFLLSEAIDVWGKPDLDRNAKLDQMRTEMQWCMIDTAAYSILHPPRAMLDRLQDNEQG